MDYIMSLVFGQALQKTGSPAKAVAVVGTLALLGVLAYGVKALIDAMVAASRKRQDRLDQEASARNVERQQLTNEVSAVHSKMSEFMERHLVKEAELLTEISAGLKALNADMQSHRVEETERAKSLHIKLEEVHRAIISAPGKGATA